MDDNKKIIFSGVQPSGILHIGNYLGALVQWVEMQEKYDCIFCVVDYHSITVKQDPEKLSKRILDTVKIYLASGIDPKKSIIFQQSAISAHTELAWILNCVARVADLNKMIQFKEKARLNRETASVGLYDYPVLQAADILLYNTDIVPVGEDQVQHVELARCLAKRFNSQFGETFKIPEVMVRKTGARIMGLDDPTKKMSKSATTVANYIALTDDPAIAVKKIIKAVTDSGSEIIYDEKTKPAIANLLTLYSLLSNKSIKELEKNYQNKGYGVFKKDLAEVVGDFLSQFQKKYYSFKDDEIREILQQGNKRARPLANKTLEQVKKKLGIKV
ncbi:MAG: tryptophan--tRNA ligase [Patescibacteria group bacterium]